MVQTWFVTGASRGLGREIVRAALDAGHRVVAAARNPEQVTAATPDEQERLLAVPLDITDAEAAHAAVDAAITRFGRIDVLVNNAGRGLLGAVEEITDTEARAVFDTNVFGTLTVTRAVLPVLRAQRSGTVVMISSVGGFTQGPGWGVYGATKAAMEGFSESLAAELAPIGIDLVIVEPGIFRTDFIDDTSLHHADARIADYLPTVGRIKEWVAGNNGLQPGDPVKGAAAIVEVVAAEKPPLRLQLGADCVARVEAKIQRMVDDLSQWRSVSVSMGFDDEDAKPGYW